jgi:hypothetical protein
MKAVAKHAVLTATLLAASFAGAQQSVRIGTLTAANPSLRTFFLVGTGLQTRSPSGYVISSTDALAQEFVLDVTDKSTSLTFVVGGSFKDIGGGALGFGGDVTFLAQLTRGLGQGSTILAQQQFTFSALPDRYYATTFSFDCAKKLPPGTYYLVLSTRSATDIGSLAWGPNGELISPFGHLGIAYYANPTGYDNPNEAAFIPATTAQTLQFQLMGK